MQRMKKRAWEHARFFIGFSMVFCTFLSSNRGDVPSIVTSSSTVYPRPFMKEFKNDQAVVDSMRTQLNPQ